MSIRTARFLLTCIFFASCNEILFAQTNTKPISGKISIQLAQGSQLGKIMFEPGDTHTGGNGQIVEGIEGSGQEMLKTHIHAHLSVFYKGEQLAIPYGIGIIKPFRVVRGFVEGGKGYYWLHTHDATGILHIESPNNRAYTLGNFFDIWGKPLDQHNVAGLKGRIRAYVDGQIFFGNIRISFSKTMAKSRWKWGNPYTSVAFGKRCQEMGVKPSMGTMGDAYDNAMAESFFASLECELIDRRSWKTMTEARLAIFTWIEAWYNPLRRHKGYSTAIPD